MLDATVYDQKNRKMVVGQWYKSVTIKIDGYHFANCRFDNCNLVSSHYDFFRFTHCCFSENTMMNLEKSEVIPASEGRLDREDKIMLFVMFLFIAAFAGTFLVFWLVSITG